LTSRCTTPAACAADSASATASAILADSSTARGPRARSARSVLPSMNSVEMNGMPWCASTSYTVRMLGWFSADAVRASRSIRARSAPARAPSTFNATGRFRRPSCARYTSPIAPAPRRSRTRWRPSTVPGSMSAAIAKCSQVSPSGDADYGSEETQVKFSDRDPSLTRNVRHR
jgi:hypothetical protein